VDSYRPYIRLQIGIVLTLNIKTPSLATSHPSPREHTRIQSRVQISEEIETHNHLRAARTVTQSQPNDSQNTLTTIVAIMSNRQLSNSARIQQHSQIARWRILTTIVPSNPYSSPAGTPSPPKPLFLCRSAHSLLANLPLSAASALAFLAASSFSLFSRSRASFSTLSRLKMARAFWRCKATSVAVTVRERLRGGAAVEERFEREREEERERVVGRFAGASTCAGFGLGAAVLAGLVFGRILARLVLDIAAVTEELRFGPAPVVDVSCGALATVAAAAGVFSFPSLLSSLPAMLCLAREATVCLTAAMGLFFMLPGTGRALNSRLFCASSSSRLSLSSRAALSLAVMASPGKVKVGLVGGLADLGAAGGVGNCIDIGRRREAR
jgi:hypothetical protein